ncbi:MAG: ribonuclease [Oscillospiraceae bacterium]|nr:ribonuclease [Oscillospiraceae bacterium]
MKRLALLLLTCFAALLLGGCYGSYELQTEEPASLVIFTQPAPEPTQAGEAQEETVQEEETAAAAQETADLTQDSIPDAPPEDEPLPASVEKDGSYTSPEDVAAYIHTFGTLPGNFLTKREAQDLGWDSRKGNLWEVAPGMSIGGDRFGNYEGLLPDGSYKECDVNYEGGFRGAERLIFGDDGSIYYTNDHYKSFIQLY